MVTPPRHDRMYTTGRRRYPPPFKLRPNYHPSYLLGNRPFTLVTLFPVGFARLCMSKWRPAAVLDRRAVTDEPGIHPTVVPQLVFHFLFWTRQASAPSLDFSFPTFLFFGCYHLHAVGLVDIRGRREEKSRWRSLPGSSDGTRRVGRSSGR